MKVAIAGSSGFVGKFLFSGLKGHEVFGISRSKSESVTHQADIVNPDIDHLLDHIKPDVIVHTAKAPGGVDYYEENRAEVRRVDFEGTPNLATWCRDNDKKLVYISTDYVYPGETNGYNEESSVRPINYYGHCKLAGEIRALGAVNCAILRPTVIFGSDPGGWNFLEQVLRKKDEGMRLAQDQISNPTDVDMLVHYVQRVIDEDIQGSYIATGPESINRMDFGMKVADAYGLNKDLFTPIYTVDLGLVAERPLNNGTDPSKLNKLLNYNPPSVLESLKRMKNNV